MIKFRGQEYATDKIIRGDKVIIENGGVDIIYDENNEPHIMQSDSVKQLVFVDSEGNEVYEGDIVTYNDRFTSDGQPYSEFEADMSYRFFQERFRLVRENYNY